MDIFGKDDEPIERSGIEKRNGRINTEKLNIKRKRKETF